MEKLIILGSGPAALTAAIYAARSELQPVIVEGEKPGGQLMSTSYVENWPGEKSIRGPELMMNMIEHAKKYNVTFISGNATSANLLERPFTINVGQKHSLKTHSLIIATGADPKKLGVPGENEYWGKGVTTCAVCDGIFYKNKPVVIVGGGDTAMENASFMLNHTNKITIVQNLAELSASAIMQDRVKNNPNVSFHFNSTITHIKGDGTHVEHVEILNQQTGEKQEIPVDAVFISIGFRPNTTIFGDQLSTNDYGYLNVTNHTKTSIPGVFAAGDVSDFRYRQAITAAGAGCMAALDAEQYIKELDLI